MKNLSEKLTKELCLLTDFQDRQKATLKAAIDRERVHLQDKINLRLSSIEQKVFLLLFLLFYILIYLR